MADTLNMQVQRLMDANVPGSEIGLFIQNYAGDTVAPLGQPQSTPSPQPQQDTYNELGLPVGEPRHMAQAINAPFVPLQTALNAPGAIEETDPGVGLEEKGPSIKELGGMVTRGLMQQGAATEALPDDITTKEDFGDMAAEVGKIGVELGALHPYTVGMTKLVGAATKGMTMIAQRYNATRGVAKIDNSIAKAVKEGMTKGVRPTVAGKGDAGKIERYFEQIKNAVVQIVENSKGVLPKTLEEFSEAIYSTKKNIHARYSGMAQEAGQAGAGIPLAPIRNDLTEIITKTNVRGVEKKLAEVILKDLAAYDDVITPQVAEDLIASYNAETGAFWKNPNPNEVKKVMMTERTTRQLRILTDKAISEYTGPGYQQLKRDYGSLRSIEKEVAHRAVVDLRKNTKGLYDLADIASASEFALGLTRMDPSLMASAAVIKGTKNYIKHLNNPNTAINDMFSDVNRFLSKKNQTLLNAARAAGDTSPEVQAAQLMIEYDPKFSKTGAVLSKPQGPTARSETLEYPRSKLKTTRHPAETGLPETSQGLLPSQSTRGKGPTVESFRSELVTEQMQESINAPRTSVSTPGTAPSILRPEQVLAQRQRALDLQKKIKRGTETKAEHAEFNELVTQIQKETATRPLESSKYGEPLIKPDRSGQAKPTKTPTVEGVIGKNKVTLYHDKSGNIKLEKSKPAHQSRDVKSGRNKAAVKKIQELRKKKGLPPLKISAATIRIIEQFMA